MSAGHNELTEETTGGETTYHEYDGSGNTVAKQEAAGTTYGEHAARAIHFSYQMEGSVMQHAGVVLIAALLVAATAPAAELFVPPQEITQLKAFYPDTTLVADGKANCTIIYPAQDGYAEVAADVAKAIKEATGAEVPVKNADEYTKADRETNLICLGQMNNNKLAFELYVWHYSTCDDWWPGPEGYLVRTCCDPWGNGKNVIMVGGIDLDGVKRSVEQLKPLISKGETLTIPRTLKVHFKDLDKYGDRVVPAFVNRFTKEFVEAKALRYGLEWQLISCANFYFLTGRDEFAELYAKMLRRWFDEYYKWTLKRQITTPKYRIPSILLSFDQIEESPLIPDDLKLEMTNLLYDYVSRMSVHGRITGLKPGILSGVGHHAVSESVVYGARYFKNYYPNADFARIDEGMGHVQTGQKTIANSNGFIDNNGGYTRYYPMTAMKLAPAMDNYDYFTSGAAHGWMEYCTIIRDSYGKSFIGRHAAWAIAAWYYKDPAYVWFYWWPDEPKPLYPECVRSGYHLPAWSYLPNIEPKKPEAVKQVHYMRLHSTNYDQIEGQGRFINVPRERTFHQLAMRTGFEADDQYLRLDGINDGIENGGDGNAIVWLTDGGQWLTHAGQWGGARSMKYHTTCLVLRDGQMWDKRVAFCDLQVAADLPQSAFVRSVMHEYNGLDWARNIAWIKGKYWVVFDQLQALEAGDYSILCQWMDGGPTLDDDFRTTRTEGEHTFVLQAAGGNKPVIARLSDGRPIIRQAQYGQLKQDDEPTFAHLLYGHPKDAPDEYSIKRLSANTCLVTEPERQVLVGVAPMGKPDEPIKFSSKLQAKCAMFALAEDEISFGGLTSVGADQPMLQTDKPIDLCINLQSGVITIDATEPTELNAVSVGPGGAAVTLPLEAKRQELPANPKSASFKEMAAAVREVIAEAAKAPVLAVEVKRPEYPRKLVRQWVFDTAAGDDVTINTVAAADLDGDGKDEVLAGTADGRLCCLNADGKQRWDLTLEQNEEGNNAINDVVVADFGDGPRILVASDDQYLHCLDAAGNELWKFTGTGIECTNQAPGEYGVGRHIEGDGEMMVVEAADLNADGVEEIIVGSRTFMHGNRRVFGTVWCLNAAGKLQWHLYQSGGWITSISAFDDTGDGQMNVAFGTRGGPYGRSTYVCDNQGKLVAHNSGPYGEKFVDVGPIGADKALRYIRLEHRDGKIEAYAPNEKYALKWTYRAGGLSAVGPELADLNGDGIDEIIVASDGGSLFCVQEGEQPLKWRLNLAEPLSAVRVVALAGETPQIAVGTSMGGLDVVSGDGKPLARADVAAPVVRLGTAKLQAEAAASLLVATDKGTVFAYALE